MGNAGADCMRLDGEAWVEHGRGTDEPGIEEDGERSVVGWK